MRNRAAPKVYNVGALSKLSGVSVRTLHHYHQIGLLVPVSIGGNGYRQYGREELLRLQQILSYRRLGMSLPDIASILNDPDFDRLASLREQRKRLSDELGRVSVTRPSTIAGCTVLPALMLYPCVTTPTPHAVQRRDWRMD